MAPQQDQYGYQIALGINRLDLASNGIAYGTAQYGGDNFGNGSGGEGDGFLFCIDTNGFTKLYFFDENSFHGLGPIGAMVQGTNGAFYGITSSGGANGYGTIFKFTPGAAAPDFVVWFDEALGKQQSEQNGYNNYGYYNNKSCGVIKAAGTIYGTAPDGGGEKRQALSISPNNKSVRCRFPVSTNSALDTMPSCQCRPAAPGR